MKRDYRAEIRAQAINPQPPIPLQPPKQKMYEGEYLAEDKDVHLEDGRSFSVDANMGYDSEFEPPSGNGWDEPKEGGYFMVSAELINFTVHDENGEQVVEPGTLQLVESKFLAEYKEEIENDIAEDLAQNASEPPDPPEQDDFEDDED